MSSHVVDFLNAGAGVHPVGERIAGWVRQYSAKECARMFGVEPRTVNSWRQGNLPQMRHLCAMAERWGVDFLEDVFAPVLAESEISVARRLERIERDIHTLRKGAEIAERDCENSNQAARLGSGKALGGGSVVARTFRSVGMILATVAVCGTLVADDENQFARTPRPPVTRVCD